MTRQVFYLSMLLLLFLPRDNRFFTSTPLYELEGTQENTQDNKTKSSINKEIYKKEQLSEMEALDAVKMQYAANFDKILLDEGENYYYKLSVADYYLTYEGMDVAGQKYLIHLYEFVLDELDTGIGHTVTYGWYTVDIASGTITDETN